MEGCSGHSRIYQSVTGGHRTDKRLSQAADTGATMTKNAHTPGPWVVSSTFIVCDSEARILAQCQPMLEIPELAPPVGQAQANARLIASAPDLLAVLDK